MLLLTIGLFSHGLMVAQNSLSSGPISPTSTPPPSGALGMTIDLGPATYNTGIGCASGSAALENDHYRTWTVTGSDALEFTNVNLVIQGITGAGAQVQAFIYTNAGGPFPAGTLTEIASSAVYTSAQTSGDEVVDLALTHSGSAMPGDEVVIKISYPDNNPAGPSYRLGYGDDTGETTWIFAPGCGANSITPLDNLGFAIDLKLILSANAAQAAAIPTMGEWGLILLSILMLTIGTVAIRQRKLAFAGSQNEQFSFRRLPLDRKLFARCLGIVGLGLVTVFAVAISLFGYEMTTADVPGSLLAIPLAAYLLHLLFPGGNQ